MEINVISEVEHENLVKLYGCCVERNSRILVYNYLENNSLSQTLLVGGHSSIYFDWRTRCRICVDIARGLAFLHEEVGPPIIHTDTKASNILLDKDLTPKISDFGLSKLMLLGFISLLFTATSGMIANIYRVRGPKFAWATSHWLQDLRKELETSEQVEREE